MSGFYAKGENFDRLFMTQHQFADRFLGNQLYTWGINSTGQLGDNSTVNRSSPGDVITAAKSNSWKELATTSTGNSEKFGLKTDGVLWSWGVNTNGGLGDGTTVNRSSPVTVVGGLTWRTISYVSGIDSNGRLYKWGFNSYGQIGDLSTTSKSSPVLITTKNDWIKVFSNATSTVAIDSNQTLWSWGRNNYGQLGNNSTVDKSSPVTVVGGIGWTYACCSSVSAGIKTDGTLWTWGRGLYGGLGDGTTTSKSSPVTVAGGGTNWKVVTTASTVTGSIKTDGTLWVWGSGSGGALGTNSVVSRSSPVTTSGGGTTWKNIMYSNDSSPHAIKTDGTLWSWGNNINSQIGDNTTVSKSSPVTVAGAIQNWVGIAAGPMAIANI